jgi:D-3-phosphoglycerate dehydrogenase
MSEVAIGVIDPFHPNIIETIGKALPASWTMRIAKGKALDARKEALRDADVAFVMAAPMPGELLAAAPRLGFIQKMGAGVDRIDLELCAARGIGVARLHAGNAAPVAEHTVLLMLAACRRLPILDRDTRAGRWDKEACRGVNRHLKGKTVGIVGFGAIGRTVAKLLSGFDVDIFYFDPIRAPAAVEAELQAAYLELDDLLARADVVSLHLPLSKETKNLIDARRIARMKPGAILVNCARGGLVDEAALVEALRSGHLFGAAVDAFAQEPPVGSPLLELEQTIVTPHAAGATIDNFAMIARRAVENTQLYLAGKSLPPGDVVLAPRKRAAVG